MREEIRTKVAAEIKRRGLDAIVTTSPENFAYLNGFTVPSQSLLRHRHAIAILSADGAFSLLVVDMEEATVRGLAPNTQVAVWKEFSESAMKRLTDELRTRGLSKARLGLEFKYLSAGDHLELSKLCPSATFETCDELLRDARQIKTTGEIDLMRRLARISDTAILRAMESVREGSSEFDFASALTTNVFSQGAEQFRLMIVATGERSQLPNVGPTGRRLQAQDVCRFEIFSLISGYQVGVCRTAVVGTPPPHAERIWAHLIDCKYMVMDLVKPGASCIEIYQRFAAKLAELDLPPISFVGHGAGLSLHEEPYMGRTAVIGKQNDVILHENMVLGIEPLSYRTGYGFGMQNKDAILITADGCELLSDVTDTDRLFVIKAVD
ncbi:Xaa-Pro peptidase family protein [Variovorax sp. J22P271]|uniref:M24 family metallopeptidase n=1 Tax=Variovorax davisae TaxID=3053515 RepID=UPI002575EE37|nr:Xaa-Pro peptidase family protein [Variovorax sp. J22P271]MDM0033434.1 Xaa-Pro peptidase family protein [Variovorax sp. J22P271]